MRGLRIVLVVLLALLGWLQYRLWFGSGGTRQVAALQERVEQQRRQNDGLRDRNAALAAEVADLKSGEAAIEERARSELGMIKPGETFYRVVDRAPVAVRAPVAPSAADGSPGSDAPAATDVAPTTMPEPLPEPLP